MPRVVSELFTLQLSNKKTRKQHVVTKPQADEYPLVLFFIVVLFFPPLLSVQFLILVIFFRLFSLSLYYFTFGCTI